MSQTLILVGCGKMGGALARAWAPLLDLHVVDPHAPKLEGAHVYAQLGEVPELKPDIVVFAVKPQNMDDVLPHYALRFGIAPLYLSIAAGKTLEYFAHALGANARIIRAMPNTPALIGQGMTVLVAGTKATRQDMACADALFATAGKTHWLADEEQMHAATALSGSGPAYVFLMLEELIRAGVTCGLDDRAARDLALQTLLGSALLATQSDCAPAELRRQVTSPGGTTEAALQVLMAEDALPSLLPKALAAALARSQELGKK